MTSDVVTVATHRGCVPIFATEIAIDVVLSVVDVARAVVVFVVAALTVVTAPVRFVGPAVVPVIAPVRFVGPAVVPVIAPVRCIRYLMVKSFDTFHTGFAMEYNVR